VSNANKGRAPGSWAMAMICLAAFLPTSPIQAAGLNDTGQQSCWNGSVMEPCSLANAGDASANPRQDGRYGRDAAATAGVLVKTGGGAGGFDFTKLAVDGSPLADQGQTWVGFDSGSEAAGTAWTCVRDNVTGLIWEIKTDRAAPDLHHSGWTYSWYEPDGSLNGGDAGTSDGTNDCFDSARCDTDKYVDDVNARNICGETADDWRLPTRAELVSILHYGADAPPYIDLHYFPNTLIPLAYWTSSSLAKHPGNAWNIRFDDHMYATDKGTDYQVRLVRGGQ